MLTVVWGLIFYDNHILIGKKKEGFHPYGLGGKWHIIGGKVKENETEEEALKREIKEETGLEIKNIKKLGEKIVKDLTDREVRISVFYCETEHREAEASSDLEKIKWVKKENLLNEICERVRNDLISIKGVRQFLGFE